MMWNVIVKKDIKEMHEKREESTEVDFCQNFLFQENIPLTLSLFLNFSLTDDIQIFDRFNISHYLCF